LGAAQACVLRWNAAGVEIGGGRDSSASPAEAVVGVGDVATSARFPSVINAVATPFASARDELPDRVTH
jgi:hypothetical protein